MLKKICWFAVLTPSYSTAEGSSSDIHTLLAATAGEKRLADALPLYKQLLDTFQTPGARAGGGSFKSRNLLLRPSLPAW